MDLSVSTLWPGRIRPHSSPGLSTCVDERRLCSDGAPLPVSVLEAEALRLAEWAFARGEPLVLCPADPLAPLPALIAAAVHVADMSEHYRSSGRAEGSARRVAVVTSDYHLKGVYRGLGVRSTASRSVAPLRDVVPAATLGRDGVVRVLGADPHRGWATVFAPSVASLAHLRDLDLIVVVPPAGGIQEALSLGVPTVVVVGDPSDPALVAPAVERAAVYGWDQEDIRRAGEVGTLPPRLARRSSVGRCEVVAVPAHAVCENAALFWQDVGPLVHSGGGGISRDLAREAFGLFHDLSALAVPIAEYERLTAPIRVRLDAVAAATRWTRGETRDLYLPMVEAELRDLAAALGDVPPKRDALTDVLTDSLAAHSDVLLVARTAEMARLHRAELAGRGPLSQVRVSSLGALAGETPADVAVLTGMAPAWARWVYRCGIAAAVRVLAYTPEGTIESVAAGYDEAEIVRRTVDLQAAREAWLARPAAKDRTWSRLSGDPRRVPDGQEHPPGREAGAASITVRSATPDLPPGLWDGDEWLADVLPAFDEERPGRDLARGSGSPVLSGVRVDFEDGRWALLDLDGTVTRVTPGAVTAQPATPVRSLSVGDQVVFFDGDGRKDLLAKVIEVAGEVPALAVAAAWVAHWRRVLAAAYRRFGTYSALAAALAREGCTVQTQTVRLWVVGVTIGPDDDQDVRRLGVVMDDPALRDTYAEVYRAFRSLRGAHVRLGQRLADMARRVAPAAAGGALQDDEVVDERSGLTVADFRESVEVLTVRQFAPAGAVPYVLIGRLNVDEATREHADD